MTGPSEPGAARHEIKFVLPAAAAEAIELWLRTSSLGFRVTHPERQVNNIYFDTPDVATVADKLAGVSRRAKVRYRWYGTDTMPAAGQLEVKQRDNAVGFKESFAVAVPPSGRSRIGFVRGLRAVLPARGRAWLDAFPDPILLNRYRRRYHASADRGVRATVDRDLVVLDQRTGPFPQLVRSARLPCVVILELKLAPALRARASRELTDLGFVASACSKYELGVRAIAEL